MATYLSYKVDLSFSRLTRLLPSLLQYLPSPFHLHIFPPPFIHLSSLLFPWLSHSPSHLLLSSYTAAKRPFFPIITNPSSIYNTCTQQLSFFVHQSFLPPFLKFFCFLFPPFLFVYLLYPSITSDFYYPLQPPPSPPKCPSLLHHLPSIFYLSFHIFAFPLTHVYHIPSFLLFFFPSFLHSFFPAPLLSVFTSWQYNFVHWRVTCTSFICYESIVAFNITKIHK